MSYPQFSFTTIIKNNIIEYFMIFVDKRICDKIPKEIRIQQNIIPVGLDGSGVLQVISSCKDDNLVKNTISKFFPGYLVKIETKDWREVRKISYSNYGFLIADPALEPKNFILNLIMDCVSLGYSDIHIEPESDCIHIRALAHGSMCYISTFSKKYWLPILAEIKLMGNMNLAETNLPQDSSISNLNFGDLRIATHPTIFGENIVIRILDKSSQNYQLKDLTLSEEVLRRIKAVLELNKGIFIICGSTNSGKSTTAHAILKYLNDGSRNIMTLEDPVEHIIAGIRQTSVNSNFGFFAGLRSILRQNPGIIFIGEIRDEETAKLAISAEMSGKMIIATLHSKSVKDSINRLESFGIKDPHNHLSFVLFQKLIPERCCESLSCSNCFGSGFKSRKLVTDYLDANYFSC